MSERDITEVTRWQTSDGKLHRSAESAKDWAGRLKDVEKANEMLSEGDTVADAARRAGFSVEAGSVLERITGDTPLVISHWQCRDQPGYKVCRFTPDLEVFVHGDAGSWSGSYGNYLRLADVVRFAEDTLKKHPDVVTVGDTP